LQLRPLLTALSARENSGRLPVAIVRFKRAWG
jgi:hypothetical protein